MLYKNKYLKYKQKYLDLKKQYGGSLSEIEKYRTKYVKAVINKDAFTTTNDTFIIPKGVNIIVIRNLNISHHIKEIDLSVENFLRERHQIFEKYGKSVIKTEKGRELESKLNSFDLSYLSFFSTTHIKFENYLEGTRMKNISLNFTKFPCDESECKIIGFDAPTPMITPLFKDVHPINCKLNELIENKGVGTYVIRTCEMIAPIMHPIQVSETSNYNVKYVKSHGAMTCKQFDIPKGVNVITLIDLDVSLPIVLRMDDELERFLAEYDFFKNNNESYVKTEIGASIEKHLNKMIEEDKIQMNIRNHVGPKKINDMILNFEQVPCDKHKCAIVAFKQRLPKVPIGPQPPILPTIKYVYPSWRMANVGFEGNYDKDIMNQERTKYNLSELINKEGPGTYIIRACRVIPGNACHEEVRMLRQTSVNNNNEEI